MAIIDSNGEYSVARHLDEGVDIVVTPYLGAESGPRPAARLWLSGAEFAVLPPGYEEPLARRENDDGPPRLLVTMGGSDPWRLTESVIEALNTLGDRRPGTTVVFGPFFDPERCDRLRMRAPWATWVEDKLDLLSCYKQTDFVIGAAGLTRYEVAALGLRSLLLNPHQFSIDYFRSFDEAGLAEIVFTNEVQSITSPREVNSGRIVDGRGRIRIVDAFLRWRDQCQTSI
jgi:spore coat polysaccharide biosynthesis predicted glycosyltransferase SpsG